MVRSPETRVDLIVRDSISKDVLINGGLMILVIAQSIKDLSQVEVWKANDDFFGCNAKFPQFGNSTNWCASADHNWDTLKDVIIGDNVWVSSN